MSSPANQLFTTEQAAEYLAVSARTLAGRRSRNEGPAYYRMGRQVRYRLEDLEAYLKHIDPENTEANPDE